MKLSKISTLDLLIADVCGNLRGKRVVKPHVEKAFESGVKTASSIQLLSADGLTLNAKGLGIDDGDPDFHLLPLLEYLVPVKQSKLKNHYQVLCDAQVDGLNYKYDPRYVLKQVLDTLAADGLFPCVAFELEFYIFDLATRGFSIIEDISKEGTEVYSMSDLDKYQEFFSSVTKQSKQQGINIMAFSAEHSPSQYEINLAHSTNSLMAADHTVLFKYLLSSSMQIHSEQKKVVSFMPKPLAEHSGNGMHIHLSLLDAEQNNIFAVKDRELSTAFENAIAGVFAVMDESMAIWNPSQNAFRRLLAGDYAAKTKSYGFDHRLASVRIPEDEAKNCRLELRTPAASANPYLTLACLLAGIHHGIKNKLELKQQPLEPKEYATVDSSTPLSIEHAIAKLRENKILREYISQDYLDLYAECKKIENDAHSKNIPESELRMYI